MTLIENPLEITRKLDSLLVVDGYATDHPARKTISSIITELLSAGYKDTPPPKPASSYTKNRAKSLRDLSLKLRESLITNTKENVLYSDRALALSTISNSYLQLAHAFKVDTKVWSFAQEDLVPILSAAVDEKTLDTAVLKLISHLDRYLKSLNKWLTL